MRRKAKAEGVPLSTYLRRLALTAGVAPEYDDATRKLLAEGLPEDEVEEMLGVVRGSRAHRS